MKAGRTMLALFTSLLLAACAAVPSPAPAGSSYVYVVERGDSLSKIAARLGVDMATLARRNGLAPPYTIHPGQRLRLPPGDRYTVAAKPGRLPVPQAQATRTAKPVATPAPVMTPAPAAPPASRPLSTSLRELGAPALAWPVDASIAGRYGAIVDGRPSDGLDFTILPGQRILSSASGTVLFAGLEPRYGQLVIIDHGGGWATAYGFVGQITVKEGDPVAYRERIGVNGTKHYKLHFQVRRDNEPKDPQVYLPPRF